MSTLLPITFQGVDEGSDPKALPPGSLTAAENVRMDKGRRLLKRRGTDVLTRTGITKATYLMSRGDDLGIVDDEFAYTYSPELDAWQTVGRPPNLRTTERGLIDSTRSVSQLDIVAYGNLLVTVFVTGYNSLVSPTFPNLYLKVEDIETGTTVVQPVLLLQGAAWPRAHVLGTSIVWTASSGSGAIWYGMFDMSTLTNTFASIVENVATVYGPCDSVITQPVGSAVPLLYYVYAMPSGTNRLKVLAATIDPLGTIVYGPATYTTISQNVDCVSITAVPTGSTAVYLGHSCTSSGSALVRAVNPTTLATSVGPVVTTSGTRYMNLTLFDSTRLLTTVLGGDSSGSFPWKMRTSLAPLSTLVETAASARLTQHIIGAGRPFKLAERWYVHTTMAPKDNSLIVNTAIPNASSVLMEIMTGTDIVSTSLSPNVQAATIENLTGWVPTRTGTMPQAVVIGNVAYVAAPYRKQEPLNFQSIPIGWNLHRIEPSSSAHCHKLAVVGAGGLSPSGSPFWFDGFTTFPYSFTTAPQLTKVFSSGIGGGSMDPGIYEYALVWEWHDNNGILHRSTPSPIKTSDSLPAGQKMTVTAATASLPQHQVPPYGTNNVNSANPVSCVLYRTTVGNTILYRLTLEPEFQLLISDPTTGVVTLLDTQADADIGSGNPARPLATQPQLYTATGELADVPPPSFITAVTHNGRIVGIGSDQRTLWFTKDFTEDSSIAPGFNEALTKSFSHDKTALASLDAALIAFGPDSIDMVIGIGPDATGGNGSWDLDRVQADVGCVNPKSPVTLPMGVAFQSQRGLEMISRDKNISWVGKPVEDTLAAFPVITSATLVALDHEVRWTCNTADGTSGIVLAWDYLNKIWFVRKYNDVVVTSNASVPFVDAQLIGGVYTMLTAQGLVMQETDEHKLDCGSAFVETMVRLAPLQAGGTMTAWGRVKDVSLMGTSLTPHKLQIAARHDYASAWSKTTTWNEGTLPTAIGPLTKARFTFTKQRCQAVEVEIRELAPTSPADYGTGEGMILEGLSFRVTQKSGPAKTAAGEQG